MAEDITKTCPYKRAKEETLAICEKYPKKEDSLIGILNEIQEKYGYIPEACQMVTAEYLEIPLAKVYGVITFYSRFTTIPKGEYDVSICMGTACFVKGAKELLEAAKVKLKINEGETSADQRFSLETMRCVGACGLAPVFTINDKVYGNATVKSLNEELDKLIQKDN